MNLFITQKEFNADRVEFVERKGLGHPDTLSDFLAETLSTNYAKYTLKKYGAVLHHNFDKVGLLGGASYVAFGEGYLTKPIRVLINGRVSTKFADEKIPTRKLLTTWVKNFFRESLPLIDPEEDLDLHLNLSTQSSPGKTYEQEAKQSARQRWFEPLSLDDLPENKTPLANDTSLGVGYAPLTTLEKIVLGIEKHLNSTRTKGKYPWMGTDIKVLGFRQKDLFYFTLCVPQISKFVENIQDYIANIEVVKKEAIKIIEDHNIKKFEISINTRDHYEIRELYLTAVGSSIESGDEGLAGRGNRINGIISPMRPLSMEGSFGKNPINHVGKVYYLAAFKIAEKVYKKFKVENEIYLASQSGRDLLDPWIVLVRVQKGFSREKELRAFIQEEVLKISSLSKSILNGSLLV